MILLGCRHNPLKEAQPMKRTENVSWLMGTVQRTLLPHREDCLASPLTEQEKRLVKILALVHRENYVPKSSSRQWRGRPSKERDAIARSFVAKAVWGGSAHQVCAACVAYHSDPAGPLWLCHTKRGAFCIDVLTRLC